MLLVLENIGMPVSTRPSVYEEVMDVWITSLKAAENLVSGVAQNVQRAEALLAWHPYPDICALGQKTTIIRQKDSSIEDGGLITIGLQSPRNVGEQGGGISSSMPLSTLRFYGKPVKPRGDLGSSTAQVSFDRFVQVVLGSILTT